VAVTTVEDVTSVPPDAAVYQPSNVYPFLVTVGSVPYVSLKYTVLLVGEGVDPPLLSNVTVEATPLHLAKRVTVAL
jgi:hypothetical protein